MSISGIQAPVTEGGTEQTAGTMEFASSPARRVQVPCHGLPLASKQGQSLGVDGRMGTETDWVLWGGHCSEKGQKAFVWT